MQIKDIMTTNVEIIRPDTPLLEAARLMRDLDVGVLPICDGRRLLGILTDRDLTVRAVAEGRNPNTAPVSDSMTPEVVYCFDDDSTADAERLMAEKQIRRLPVLDHDQCLVGIISLGDLAVRTKESKVVGKTLERVSEPSDKPLATMTL